jgi:hypothetical protein
MALLRRSLYLKALESAVAGVALIGVPRLLLVAMFGQPEYVDYALVRLLGVADVTLALVIVLVAQRIEDLWWWSWAFVILVGGQAIVVTLHAAFGLPPASAAWPWWAWGALQWAFAFAFLWGIARAGTERPPG